MTIKQNAKGLTTTAMMAAVLCILGPMTIPIGPVPVTLANLAIFLTVYILGTKRGAIACLLYILIGLVGLPVFSGFSGGVTKLAGPTGGYIIGYLPMAVTAGLIISGREDRKLLCIAGMELATWILYLLGTAWLAFSAGMTFGKALEIGVIPFIVLDLIKIVICAYLGPILKKRLGKYI